MFELRNIRKEYEVGDTKVHALNGVSVSFEGSGFTAILGPSGCGKTTLMNIIGGLDRYTANEGEDCDMLINGVSTKNFTDADWNSYRNHKVGFVFQSYNLIPHMTVLANVELAMTLSGVEPKERRERAIHALSKVGLEAQLHKKPNQMSGGQMQRVAIARAIVNSPEVLLADEPTGAVDSETGIQIMKILQEISSECCVIMVTHNKELAVEYVDRIITMKDGLILREKANTPKHEKVEADEKLIAPLTKKKANMSFLTSLKLSFTNLLNKRGRSILTIVAASISIVCIALILAMNSGFEYYISAYEKDSLGKYPLQVSSPTSSILDIFNDYKNGGNVSVSDLNLTSMMDLFKDNGEALQKYPPEEVAKLYKVILAGMEKFRESGISDPNGLPLDNPDALDDIATDFGLKLQTDISVFVNDIKNPAKFDPNWGTARIDYGLRLNVWDESGYAMLNPLYDAINKLLSSVPGGGKMDNTLRSVIDGLDPWSLMVSDMSIVREQYDVWGRLPGENGGDAKKEIVVVVDEYNRIDDYILVCLGKLDMLTMMMYIMGGKLSQTEWPFFDTGYEDEEGYWVEQKGLIGTKYQIMSAADCYKLEGGQYKYDVSRQNVMDNLAKGNAITTEIVGVVRLKKGLSGGCISGRVGYSSELARHLISRSSNTSSASDAPVIYAMDTAFKQYEKDKEDMKRIIEAFTKGEYDVQALLNSKNSLIIGGAILDLQSKGLLTAEDTPARIADIFNKIIFVEQEITVKDANGKDQKVKVQVPQMRIVNLVKPSFKSGSDYLTTDEYYEFMQSYIALKDLDKPTSIYLYPKSIAGKKAMINYLNSFNKYVTTDADFLNSDGYDKTVDYTVVWTDELSAITDSMKNMINTITYILIAVAAVAIIVAMLLVAIILYISVQDRTKEIGLLRALGASKGNVSSVFVAETFIIGLVSGIIGVIVALIVIFPANAIIGHVMGIKNLLKPIWWHELMLIFISFGITVLGGIIPAVLAAKKDPVTALRAE